ncbi:protein of unknown function [Xenorhabdus poinarii G6]|uniref:Uncharacterized protein n=1 Tax=Xenorhabdus poinarii G6 TaxID=1354304 RepID=A0A068R1Z2_9GAMM|nr:hypothetical protein [Xenorhabdus poinarii]CDG21262.1 protein of unknown function [Xenorhabdus poinarii G6]
MSDKQENKFIVIHLQGSHGYQKGRDQYRVPFMYKSNNPQYNGQFIASFCNKDGYLSGLMDEYILANLIGYDIDPLITQQRKKSWPGVK